ncbi:MAG: hypothetical protein M1825_002622 [Sarcosagium campestre]|nr:MAG: hypothetical protein M1825_002622 [Sarcosagium campestre]
MAASKARYGRATNLKLAHFYYNPNRHSPVDLTTTENPSGPLFTAKERGRVDRNRLYSKILMPASLAQRVVRSWATRRTRVAIREAMEARGLDVTGRWLSEEERGRLEKRKRVMEQKEREKKEGKTGSGVVVPAPSIVGAAQTASNGPVDAKVELVGSLVVVLQKEIITAPFVEVKEQAAVLVNRIIGVCKQYYAHERIITPRARWRG